MKMHELCERCDVVYASLILFLLLT